MHYAVFSGVDTKGYWCTLSKKTSSILSVYQYLYYTGKALKCDVLAAAVMTPVILKYRKVIDMNHFYVPFAHSHVNVLKEAAKHGIRLTGELVS